MSNHKEKYKVESSQESLKNDKARFMLRKVVNRSSQEQARAKEEPLLDHFGVIWDNLQILWDHLGVIWDHLVIIWDHLGVILDHFGIIWDHFGIILDHLGNI